MIETLLEQSRSANSCLKVTGPIGGRIKRVFDFVTAIIIIILLSPLFIVVATILKLTEQGPIIYKHIRIGYRGRHFVCFKFRTMVVDSENVLKALLDADPDAQAEWQRSQKLADDPRITRVGYLLRRSCIDELPQLISVLRGDMSLVGPRPIVASEMSRYGDQIGLYLLARPGLTGAWQVGRDDCCYNGRVEMDANYVSNWCFWTDLNVLLRTASAVIKGNGNY
jgi:exopolysaccharide production protein ExoY